MAVQGSTKALVQFAYLGGMPIGPAAQAAGVSVTSARRWVKGLPPTDAAASPPADLAEVLQALRRIERELAFDPASDAVILPKIAVATRGDLARLQQAIWRVGGAVALALFALAGVVSFS